MYEYIIREVDIDGFNRYLLCLTFESLIDCFTSIEASPKLANGSGRILIDQLLITGNGSNRFLCCNYQNGKIDVTTATNVLPDKRFHVLTVQLLQKNYLFVENSILTETQRQYIKKGIAF